MCVGVYQKRSDTIKVRERERNRVMCAMNGIEHS
jgi:hypothetical protein